tara:strand:+ start:5407 stop:5586 length:180 start_codon:yes stop_codon:yes gene_type:complete
MKKLLGIVVLLITMNSYVLAKNSGAPASSQPGWGSDGFGIIGVIVLIAMIWLFWSSRDK